jgi:predicted ATPase
MEDVFVTNIHVSADDDNSTDFDIPLSLSERKHLVVTGFNGCGKTRFLESLRDKMVSMQQVGVLKSGNNSQLVNDSSKNSIYLSLSYSNDISNLQNIQVFFFPASRSKALKPKRTSGSSLENLNFLDYMLKISKNNNSCPENPAENLALYRQCICGLQGFLQELYEEPNLELKEDLANFNFFIHIPDKKPFAIDQASDGFASLINIYLAIALHSALINGTVDYRIPAIVLIDELEAHLHVSLQKRIFPILVRMFPNVQFMVTTNSPFIIIALENATVFDIEKKKSLERASFYSYTTIVESYFCTKQHSQFLQKYLVRYRELALKKNRTRKEKAEFFESFNLLSLMTPANYELFLEFEEIERKRRAMAND